MRGAIAVIIGLLLLPGSVVVLLAANFGVFTADSPEAARFDKVRDFDGGEGNGWRKIPSPEENKTLNEELTAAKQLALNEFIKDFNKDVKDSSKEVDVTNL